MKATWNKRVEFREVALVTKEYFNLSFAHGFKPKRDRCRHNHDGQGRYQSHLNKPPGTHSAGLENNHFTVDMHSTMHQHNGEEEADRNDKLKKTRQPVGHYSKKNFARHQTRGRIF